MSADIAPREHVARLIEEANGKGWTGEQILQLIEHRTLGHDPAAKRIVFFNAGPVTLQEG